MAPDKYRVVAATTNKNKAAELTTVAARFGITIVSPDSLGLGVPPNVEETGDTYEENALLKAQVFSRWSSMPAIGDDSGIEIVALDNRPGLFSARYAGPGASDADLVAKVLKELSARESQAHGTVDRTAYYVCSLVLVDCAQGTFTAHSRLRGQILRQPRGFGGFGYDPIMELESLQKTLAEVDFSITCTEGFRAKAAEKLFAEYSRSILLANSDR